MSVAPSTTPPEVVSGPEPAARPVQTAIFGLAIAGWLAYDTYQRTAAPGPRAVWAGLAGLGTFGTLWYLWRTCLSKRDRRDSAMTVTDARGAERPIAHIESAGLLARGLPAEVRRDVRDAGLSATFTELHLADFKPLMPCLALMAMLALLNWGAPPSFLIFFPLAFLSLASGSRSPMPERMMRAYLRHWHCPACGYSLADVPAQADGCTVCPECGAAWRVDHAAVARRNARSAG